MGVLGFIKQGISTFRLAAVGQYQYESEVVGQIRAEVMEYDTTLAADKKRLNSDFRNIATDLRHAVNKQQWENKK